MNGQNLRSVIGYGYGMFKVGRKLAVGGNHGPLVIQYLRMPVSQVEHGLDGDAHSNAEQRAHARLPVVGHLGVLVQEPADAVSHVELPNDHEVLAHVSGNLRADAIDASEGYVSPFPVRNVYSSDTDHSGPPLTVPVD